MKYYFLILVGIFCSIHCMDRVPLLTDEFMGNGEFFKENLDREHKRLSSDNKTISEFNLPDAEENVQSVRTSLLPRVKKKKSRIDEIIDALCLFFCCE